MSNVLKNSVFVGTIVPLRPNQALMVFEHPIYFESGVSETERRMLLTLEESNSFTLVSVPEEITELYLPANTTTINDNALLSQIKLKKVEGTQNLVEILSGAFVACVNLERIDLGNVQNIGDGAFAECAGLKNVALSKVKTIGNESFMGCTQAEITLNDNVEEVGADAFKNVKHLYYFGNLPGAPWGATAWN